MQFSVVRCNMVIDRQVTPDYGQNNNNNILTDRTRLSDPKLATASTLLLC